MRLWQEPTAISGTKYEKFWLPLYILTSQTKAGRWRFRLRFRATFLHLRIRADWPCSRIRVTLRYWANGRLRVLRPQLRYRVTLRFRAVCLSPLHARWQHIWVTDRCRLLCYVRSIDILNQWIYAQDFILMSSKNTRNELGNSRHKLYEMPAKLSVVQLLVTPSNWKYIYIDMYFQSLGVTSMDILLLCRLWT